MLKICGFLPKHRISYFMLLVNTYFTIYIQKSELFEIILLNFDITIAKSAFSSSNTKNASFNRVPAESFAKCD